MADENKKENGAEPGAEPHIESKIVKKSIPQRIAAFLVSKDYKAIFGDVYKNILSPELKKIAFNSITAVIRDLIYRGTGVDAPPSSEYTNYSSYSSDGRYSGSESRRYRDNRDISYGSYQEAEEVLRQMRAFLAKKGFVTVADYYIFSNQSPTPSSYDFGWMRLDKVTVYNYGKEGARRFGLKFPEPMPIDKRN